MIEKINFGLEFLILETNNNNYSSSDNKIIEIGNIRKEKKNWYRIHTKIIFEKRK